MSKCDIYLQNYKTRYFSGDTIKGIVLCRFAKDQKVHGITLSLRGVATIIWRTNKKSYHEQQVLLDANIELLPRGTVLLPKGVYTYAFSYQLPQRLPSTFLSKRSKIEYTIKAAVKCPFLKLNYEAYSPFVVITPVNLNLRLYLNKLITWKAEKDTCCLFRSQGRINVEVCLPISGFVVKQPVTLHISVDNKSQSNVDHVLCNLKKKIVLMKQSNDMASQDESTLIFKGRYEGVCANSKKSFHIFMSVNPIFIPNFIDCDIIKMAYYVELTFVISGMQTNLNMKIPVAFGQIPFIKHERRTSGAIEVGLDALTLCT